MKKKLLVTGLSGFVGQHIRRTLQNQLSVWELADIFPPFDLTCPQTLEATCKNLPDAVIHLAAQSSVPDAFKDPKATYETNFLGTLNLLQTLKNNGFKGTFLYISSGDVYGQVAEQDLPISELTPAKPRNPYAVSKLSTEHLCLQWAITEGWRVMIARPFNHIGPGQSDRFVIADMAQQISRVRQGLQSAQIQVGDIDVTRDFLDVRDVIHAYLKLLEKGQSGEIYNICSDQEFIIRELILNLATLADTPVELIQDPTRLRIAEQRRARGCSEKLRKTTGWQPEYPITITLESMLNDSQAEALL